MITYIGRSCVVSKEGIFLKNSDYKYYRDISAACSGNIQLFLYESTAISSTASYSYKIDFPLTHIAVLPIRRRLLSLPSFIFKLLSTLYSSRQSKHVVFSYYPNTITAYISLINRIFFPHGQQVSYIGGDYQQIISLVVPSLVKRLHLRFVSFLIKHTSNNFITAGPVLYQKYSSHSRNCLLTQPFLWLYDQPRVFPKRKLNPPNSLHVAVIGVLNKRKGSHLLPRIFSVLSQYFSLQVSIVGTGPLENSLVQALSDLPNVHGRFYGYIGSTDDLSSILIDADLLLLPSYAEGFPRVIYEALFFNCLVAARDIGSVSSILDSFKLGAYVFPQNSDEQQIASFITHLVRRQDIEHLHKLGQEAIDKILNDSPARQHLNYFTSL